MVMTYLAVVARKRNTAMINLSQRDFEKVGAAIATNEFRVRYVEIEIPRDLDSREARKRIRLMERTFERNEDILASLGKGRKKAPVDRFPVLADKASETV